MLTYTTLDGHVLDLSDLSEAESAYFRHCYDEFCANVDWVHFNNVYLNGPENPLLHDTHGVVTRNVWGHPLFQAVHDLSDRLGIAQGMLAPSGNVESDPLGDEWISSTEAAREKGVSLPGLHKAIGRGAVIAHPAHCEGKRILVSVRSLRTWQPSPVRQAARRKANPVLS